MGNFFEVHKATTMRGQTDRNLRLIPVRHNRVDTFTENKLRLAPTTVYRRTHLLKEEVVDQTLPDSVPLSLPVLSDSGSSLEVHITVYTTSKYFIKLTLFSLAPVVGLPKSSLAPIEHFTSIKLSKLLSLTAKSALSNSSKESTLITFG